jgi:hypothetical protein
MNPHGEISVAESVGNMLKLIDGLRADDSGKFMNYKGEIMPW